jgi:uncharacterized protein YoxC
MHIILAQIATSQWPVFFALFAGAVGVLGCIAAFVAHASTSRDRSAIENAKTMLASSESWVGAHTHSEHELSEWFKKRTIDPESGVADVIRACWSAWLGSRSTSLTELHVLVARRERTKAPARLSAGIAALLLVIGIVGTLFSVKPILKDFQFRASTPEGVMPAVDAPTLVNVEDSTALVNTLMHSLGDAFLPSLVALGFTILVVALRGIYSLGLQRYTLELDRFAMGTIMPHYRPRSISDEYEEVRTTFGSLAKTMGNREEKFDQVIIQLTKFVDSVGPTLAGLDTGIDKMTTAADALATKSNSIADTLSRTLGIKSPLYAAVNGFEGIFATTNERLDQLSQHIEGIRSEQQEDRKAMLGTLDEISGVIKRVSGDHQHDRENVSKNIADLKAVVEKIPANLIESARKTFDDGIAAMRTTLKESLDIQAKDAESVYQHTRSRTQETLDLISQSLTTTITLINDSVKTLPEAVDRLRESLNRKSETEKAAADAIASLALEAKAGIHESIKTIPAAVDRLNESVNRKSETEKAAAEAIASLAQEAKAGIRSSYEDAARKQTAPSTPVPTIILNPKSEPSRTTDLDSIPNLNGEPPQLSPPVASELDHDDRGRGFFGGFFGGRKS